MTLFQALILGIVQGITEFIPVSSSAHLVIVPALLGWSIPANEAFVFDVLVQVATLAGVFAYFWRDIADITSAVFWGIWRRQPFTAPSAKLGWLVLIATLPAGVVGLLIKDLVEKTFDSPRVSAIFLLVTAVVLLIAERFGKRARPLEQLGWKDAVWVGFFQALALFPGISRSGATIAGGMTRNLERQAAARFSFLMSIPIILAAGASASFDLSKIPDLPSLLPIFIPGFLVAAITGYLSIRWLLGYLKRRPLIGFAVYCVIISLITLVVIQIG
jgi:undecaprenyl-diphosphatase